MCSVTVVSDPRDHKLFYITLKDLSIVSHKFPRIQQKLLNHVEAIELTMVKI